MALLLLLLARALADASPAAAQWCGVCGPEHRPGGEAAVAAANALLSGLTAAVRGGGEGGRVRAFLGGAAGGVLVYAGKRTAVARFDGAGLAGRQIAAVGSSIGRNAALGHGLLREVMLPAGPVRLYLAAARPGGPRRVSARLDAMAVLAAGYQLVRPGNRLDAAESLSAGALVFVREAAPAMLNAEGAHFAGSVVLLYPSLVPGEFDPEEVARVGEHERVHAIQYDQAYLLWGEGLDRWVVRRAGLPRAIHHVADLSLQAPLVGAAGGLIPYHARPWEAEAHYLARTRGAAD